MTDPQLKELYRQTCYGKNYEPNDGQFKLWKQTLGWADERDLAQAIVWYYESNTAFPMPAELKPLIERSRRAREAKVKEESLFVHWRCPKCGHLMSGFLRVGAELKRYCPSNYGPIGTREMLPRGSQCCADMVVESIQITEDLKESRMQMGNKT